MDKKIIAVFLAIVAFSAIAFSIVSITGRSANGNTVKSEIEEFDGPIKEFTMTSFTEIIDGEYFPQYSIDEITVDRGDLVRITVTVTSGTHDFNIDEFGISEETPLNEPVTIEFVADQAGTFEYYCSLPNHRENGHWGTLNVLE